MGEFLIFKYLTKFLNGCIIKFVHAPLAQLDRALVYETEGRGFESLTVHQLTLNQINDLGFLFM